MRRDSDDSHVSTRGVEAEQVLSNQAYVQALELLRTDVVLAWKTCPIRDIEGQRLYLQLAKMTDKFDRILKEYVEAGRYVDMKKQMDELRDESGARRALRKVI